MPPNTPETIAAIATAAGTGSVGVVRVSGPLASTMAALLLGRPPRPRYAHFAAFRDARGGVLDQGLLLFFPAPASFTGEDVLELQGHGGPRVLDRLLARVLELGARPARPGEFSERAFLNGKMDLVQAEAVADLIEAGTRRAAHLAARTLEGRFSRRVGDLLEALVEARALLEGGLDFPDEDDTDLFSAADLDARLRGLAQRLAAVRAAAARGRLLRDGLTLVIAGAPNAGKSSLLNVLAGEDRAIVSAVPGTTRDLLREPIQLDGLPLHLVDTAGLHEGRDPVEREGIRRARAVLETADRILWIYDATRGRPEAGILQAPEGVPVTLVRNKIDLLGESPGLRETGVGPELALSALTGEGLPLLEGHLRAIASLDGGEQGEFLARRRHLHALDRAADHLQGARSALESGLAPELVAEDLRLAQRALGEITGEFLPEDLLGEIFGRFCLGK